MSTGTIPFKMGPKIRQISLYVSPATRRIAEGLADARGCSVQDIVELGIRTFSREEPSLVPDDPKPLKIAPQLTQHGFDTLGEHSKTLGLSKAEIVRRAIHQLVATEEARGG